MKQNNKKNLKLLYLPDYFFYNELELIKLGKKPWSFYSYAACTAKRFSIDVDVISIGDKIPRRLPRRAIKIFFRIKSLFQAIQSIFVLHKYDVVLAWRGTAIFILLARLLIRWKKPKVIFIAWRPFDTTSSGLKYFFKRFIAKKIAFTADRIICVSTLQKNIFQEILKIPEGKIAFLPYSVDCNFFRPSNEDNAGDFILSVGSADRDNTLLRRVISDLPGIKLIETGKGVSEIKFSENSSLNQQKNTEDKIRILSVSFEKLRDLYQKCLFAVLPILPTTDQPAGLTSLLEAMAMGKPVIISKGLTTEDYIINHKNGILVEPGNFKQLKKSITELINNPKERSRIGENARKSVENKFTLEKCSKLFAELIWAVHNEKLSQK